MKIVVVGGGASGMMAAGVAGSFGNEVVLIEKNERLGKKLYITGKGRCNITNACDIREFLSNVISNRKFLTGAINKFSPNSTINFCEKYGLELKIERGNRVFPNSDKSISFINTMETFLEDNGVRIKYNTFLKDIILQNGAVKGIVCNNFEIDCDKIIIATGGMSYRDTGSTGDGYAIAKKCGHNIISIRPGLVGIELQEDVSVLAGLSLKNVSASVYIDEKCVESENGEMLFTHSGVSGPIILSLSSKINRLEGEKFLKIDLKPALDEQTLSNRLLRDFEKYNNKDFKNSLDDITVKSLIPIIIEKSGIDANKKVNQITKEERSKLVKILKFLTFKINKLSDLNGAIITSGGVDVLEVNPKNMESKLVKGLYFVGEVLDVDALTGGFNIQIALSTGYLAGNDCK